MFDALFQPVPTGDWTLLGLLFAGICLLVGLAEILRFWMNGPREVTRKIVHVLVGVMASTGTVWLETALPLALLGAVFTVANTVAFRQGWFKSMHGDGRSIGTPLYPLSFLVLVLFCWPDRGVIVAAMLVLAFGDAGAAVVGGGVARPHRYVLVADSKSLEGSVAMFVISGAVLLLVLHLFPFEAPFETPVYLMVPVMAVLATAAEASSRRGSDNVSVPLVTAFMLWYMMHHAPDASLMLAVGTALGGLVAVLSWRAGLLTGSGAVATFWLAVPVFGFGGWMWTAPMVTFFLLSSLLSKVGRRVKAQYDLMFEKGDRRDWAQVVANGGIAGGLMVLFTISGDSDLYLYYCIALAAATADTWATELGTLSKGQPRLVTTFRKVAAGTSGGVTVIGLLGAFTGALVIAMVGWLWAGDAQMILWVTLSGVVGSLMDSFLGTTVQAQYRCSMCEQVTEKRLHCEGAHTDLLSGVSWIRNDVVNFSSSVGAVLFCYLLRS